ncbi:MAG: hypothetical protein GC150_04315 [Rhizobiales bacterium]|nr:hypothetical protein [Hyphomicrobiales bacterium]
MLGRLVLILLQIAGGWFASQALIKYIPVSGDLRLGALVIIAAIVVWLIGIIGAEVLKDVGRPSGTTLATALVVAALAAALKFVPGLKIPFAIDWLPVIGAVIGYQLRR